ncbi:hypothetical protein [Methanopyrus sp. KOL6]|uniref:hypothetical protein n=1 Tax=Methanopyrus sp. KOL6 TaxID=1937004 RepID=UPI0012F8FCB3|nr:hypothetical protein [Methanopyrus sp. KOL6]
MSKLLTSVLIGLWVLSSSGCAQAVDVPDPTLGAGKAVVRFVPSSSGWIAQIRYYPPRGKQVVVSATGSVVGYSLSLQDKLVGGPVRVGVVSVDEYAPELSGLLDGVRVKASVDRGDSSCRAVVSVSNGTERPVMIRVVYSNWAHLDFGDRSLDQDVSLRLDGRKVELKRFSVRGSEFVRADLVRTDSNGFSYPYVRVLPGQNVVLHLEVGYGRSPGKVTVIRRVLSSESPVPARLDVSVLRPVGFGVQGSRVSFWAPAPGVGYVVRCLVHENGRMVPKVLNGECDRRGVVSVDLGGDPEFVSVYLRQPAKVSFEVRDRVGVSLRPSSGAGGLWLKWSSSEVSGGIATDVRLRGHAGGVFLGLILDSTDEGVDVSVDGGEVVEKGVLPSGRVFVVVDVGEVDSERVVRVVSGVRVLDVLAKVVGGDR